MYKIHIKTELSTLRAYKNGSYDERSEPLFACTIHYISDTEVYICNARGELNINALREIALALADMGIERMRYERNGKMKEERLSRQVKKRSFIDYFTKLANGINENDEVEEWRID